MPKINLGRVVGRDGGFGNIETVYLNDGGAPRVTVEQSGEDSAKDFRFTFANLVRDVATADEVDRIAAGETVQSSNVVTVGVMSSIWGKIKAAFAPKQHKHDASDITTGKLAAALLANGIITEAMLSDHCVTADKLADGSVGVDHLDAEMREDWESLSQISFAGGATGVTFDNGTSAADVQHPMIRMTYGAKQYGLMLNFVAKTVYCIDFSDRSRDFTIKA